MNVTGTKSSNGVAAKVSRARLEAALTQEELAELVGVSLRSIAHWEAGRMPRGRHLRRLAEATGKPLSFFFEEMAA
jgi:transcriptional regulator with XRE-family HTH domain